jgi:hypothetical protein
MLVKSKITRSLESNDVSKKVSVWYLFGFIPVYKTVCEIE